MTRSRLVAAVAAVSVVAGSAVAGLAPAAAAPPADALAGTPVRAGLSAAQAPVLRPGLYRDDIPDETELFYAVDVPLGVTPRFSATLVRPELPAEEEVTDGLKLLIRNAAGDQCGNGYENELHGGPYGYRPVVPYAELAPIEPEGGFGSGGCGVPGRYLIVLERDSKNARSGPSTTRSSDALLPVELLVTLEPPVRSAAGLPAPIEQDPSDVPALPATAPVRRQAGGTGFSDAPLVGPGTYAGTIRGGGSVFYRVRLQFGERLRWTARAAPIPGRSRKWGDYLATLETRGYTPVREQMRTYDSESVTNGYPRNDDFVARETVVKDVTYPVMYRNREARVPQNVAGDYYVRLTLWNARGMDGDAVPLTLTVAVDGRPSGAPEYGAAGAARAAGSAGPAGSAGSAGTGAGPAAAGERASDAARARAAERMPAVRLAAYVGGGVLLLTVVLVLALLVASSVRRRAG